MIEQAKYIKKYFIGEEAHITNKYIKSGSTFLMIREMQSQTTWRSILHSFDWQKLKTENIKRILMQQLVYIFLLEGLNFSVYFANYMVLSPKTEYSYAL